MKFKMVDLNSCWIEVHSDTFKCFKYDILQDQVASVFCMALHKANLYIGIHVDENEQPTS